MVATINNYGGFYSTELYVYEARKFGATVHAPCLNNSDYYTALKGHDIYIGFHLLHSFTIEAANKVLRERLDHGPFQDFDDFTERVKISLEQITILIRIDAFRFTGKNKRSLMWEAHFKVAKKPVESGVQDLFRIQRRAYNIPALENTWQEDAFDQIELLGFPLYSPFSLSTVDDIKPVLVKNLANYEGKRVWVKGYLIHAKRTNTSKNEKMFFGTFLDPEGNWLDTVHFPNVAAKYPFRGKGIYKVSGKVTIDYDCILIEADYAEKLGVIEDPRYSNTVLNTHAYPPREATETTKKIG
jgi:DNA polymerase III alpha subunit